MTIKEIEKVLEVPRATIRFYEKEGLIDPKREANGYRTYSDEDVELLRKIIILRKIGLSVNEISDLFDGARTLNDVLDENIDHLEEQMNELKGAMKLSRQMLDASIDIDTLDTVKYWNVIDEEEENGNRFIDIAKDISKEEKKVIFSYLGWTDENGNLYSPKQCIVTFIVGTCVMGVLACWVEKKEWTAHNLLASGIGSFLTIMVIECIISVPLYFLGKKFPWIAKNRYKVLFIACGVLLLVMLILIGIAQIFR